MDFAGAGALTAFAATGATGDETTACGAGLTVSTTIGAFTVPAETAAGADTLRTGAVSAPFPSPRFISLTKLFAATTSFRGASSFREAALTGAFAAGALAFTVRAFAATAVLGAAAEDAFGATVARFNLDSEVRARAAFGLD